MRECRRLALAHIGEQDTAPLHHRIGLLADIGAHPAALGLSRGLEAAALDIEQPAMEGAAQPAILQASVGEIGSAVRAGAIEQSVASLLVAEQPEAFPQQADRLAGAVIGE